MTDLEFTFTTKLWLYTGAGASHCNPRTMTRNHINHNSNPNLLSL